MPPRGLLGLTTNSTFPEHTNVKYMMYLGGGAEYRILRRAHGWAGEILMRF